MDGARGRIRTADTRIFSPLLYQLSYPGSFIVDTPLSIVKKRKAVQGKVHKNGRNHEIGWRDVAKYCCMAGSCCASNAS